jgi:hypothetical protein
MASAPFPRQASLNQSLQANPTAAIYPWHSIVFRSAATTMLWLCDPVAVANASTGIQMFGNDPKPIVFPGLAEYFSAYAVGAGLLTLHFFQADELEL